MRVAALLLAAALATSSSASSRGVYHVQCSDASCLENCQTTYVSNSTCDAKATLSCDPRPDELFATVVPYVEKGEVCETAKPAMHIPCDRCHDLVHVSGCANASATNPLVYRFGCFDDCKFCIGKRLLKVGECGKGAFGHGARVVSIRQGGEAIVQTKYNDAGCTDEASDSSRVINGFCKSATVNGSKGSALYSCTP